MSFTIGELAQHVTGGNERAIRKMLNDAGADPQLNEYATAPGETVGRGVVVDLLAMRAGDRVGRKLSALLRDTPGLTCGLCGATVGPADVDAHLSSHTAGLFVNVWTLRPWLALSAGVQGGRETLRQLTDDEHTAELVEALTQAVEDQGGALNVSGRYYIPDVTATPLSPRRCYTGRGRTDRLARCPPLWRRWRAEARWDSTGRTRSRSKQF
jgi:hypothetical protein